MKFCQLPALPDPFFNQVIVLPAKLPQPQDLICTGITDNKNPLSLRAEHRLCHTFPRRYQILKRFK